MLDKPIKLADNADNLFFMGCGHWRHDRDFIYTPRGFKSVAEHDEALIKRWNETCSADSTCFHLGDLIFNDSDGVEFDKLMLRLNFRRLYLLLGNHNSGQKKAYERLLASVLPSAEFTGGCAYPIAHGVAGSADKMITFLPQYVEVEVNGDFLVLCHYPIYSHNKQAKGSYMICSHSHGNCDLTNKDKGQGRRLDVGVESFGRPVSLSFIKRHLKNRDLNSVDHHKRVAV